MSNISRRRFAATTAIAAASAVAFGSGVLATTEPAPPATDAASGTAAAGDVLAPQPLAETAHLKVGIAANVEVFAPLLLANAMGEFEKENIEVEIFNTLPADVLLMLSTGDADAAVFAVDAGIFNAVNSGIDIRWVSGILEVPDDTNEGFIVSTELLGDQDPAEFDFSTLAGTTIAVPRAELASAQMHDLLTALDKGGLTLDDVTLLPSSNPDHVTAIENGAAQAINAEVDPFASQIINDGAGVLVQPLMDDIATGGYFLSGSLVDDDPEVAAAFMRAMVRTQQTYLQPGYHDDTEVVDTLAGILGTEADAIAGAPEKLFRWTIPAGSFETLQDMFLELGVLDYTEPLDPSSVVDTSLVDPLLDS